MIYLLWTLTIMIIASQAIHTWFTFESFSRIEQPWLRRIQSVMICSILSVLVLVFVWSEKETLAIIAVGIEVIINLYYYSKDFWINGFKSWTKRKKSVATFWRKNWIAFFFGILIPSGIYILSFILKNFEG